MKLIYPLLTIGAVVADSNGDAEERQAMKPGRFHFGKNKLLFAESDEKDLLRIKPTGEWDQTLQSFKDMTEFYFEYEKEEDSPFFPKKPADELNYRIRQVKTDRYVCAGKSGKAMLTNKYLAKNCEWNINLDSKSGKFSGKKIGIQIIKVGSQVFSDSGDLIGQDCLWSKGKSMAVQPCAVNEHVIKIDGRMLLRDAKRGDDDVKPEDAMVGKGGDGDDAAENEENGGSQRYDPALLMQDHMNARDQNNDNANDFLDDFTGFSDFLQTNLGKIGDYQAHLQKFLTYRNFSDSNILGDHVKVLAQWYKETLMQNENFIKEMLLMLKATGQYIIKADSIKLSTMDRNGLED